MRYTISKAGALLLLLPLFACAQPQDPKDAKKAQQSEMAEIQKYCSSMLPPHFSAEEMFMCGAYKGVAVYQLALANVYLENKPTPERCAKGQWWMEKAAKTKDAAVYAQIAEVYNGEVVFDAGKKRITCTKKGFIKKDKVKAYAYLLAAQNLLEAKKDPQKPHKPTCHPDYKLALESWGKKLSAAELAAANAFSTNLLK